MQSEIYDDFASISPIRWMGTALDVVFPGSLSNRGPVLRKLLEPALLFFNAMIVVDGYAGYDDQSLGIEKLGRLLAERCKKTEDYVPSIHFYCARHSKSKKNRGGPTGYSTSMSLCERFVGLLEGGGLSCGNVQVSTLPGTDFTRYFHDRFIAFGKTETIMRHPRLVTLGAGIRALAAEKNRPSIRDSVSRIGAERFKIIMSEIKNSAHPPEKAFLIISP